MKLTRRRIRKRSSRVKRQKLGRKTKNRRKSFRKKRTKGRRRRRRRRSRRGGAEETVDLNRVYRKWEEEKKKMREEEKKMYEEQKKMRKEEEVARIKEMEEKDKENRKKRHIEYYSEQKNRYEKLLKQSKNRVLKGPDDPYPTFLGYYVENAELHNRTQEEEKALGRFAGVDYNDLKIDNNLIVKATEVWGNLMKEQEAEKERRRSRSIKGRAEKAARGVKKGFIDVKEGVDAYFKKKMHSSAKVGAEAHVHDDRAAAEEG